MRIVIDAGHGRGRSNGKSTALGAHGPSGVCEADVTIRLARLLARRLGSGVALTRTDDDNPTLAERAERARQFDADVLVSLHANQGAPPARGAEVWIHDRASEASRVLAGSVGEALTRLDGEPPRLSRGNLALLVPEVQKSGTAACLVEVDNLSNPVAERRLRNEHEQLLELQANKYAPLDPSKMTATTQAGLDPRARVELYGGDLWIFMSFALRDEAKQTARWVPPGHSRADIAAIASVIDPEIAKLPAAARASIEPHRSIVIAVATHEGGFGATSGASDDTASLGIFQWGAKKASVENTSSLGLFFRDLSDRAAAAAAIAPAQQNDEQKLFVAAMDQCSNKNLSVAGNQLRIGGVPANGGAVETLMKTEMAKGSLRTYQLIAAVDWIEQFQGTIVRPGVNAGTWIDNGYDDPDFDGLRATFTVRGRVIELGLPDTFVTIGQMFTSPKELASAVILGVNRPHYVETAAWRTLAPDDAAAQVTDALRALLGELLAGGAKARYTDADIDAAGALAVTLRAQIRMIVWPTDFPPEDEQWRLVHDFRRHALKLYVPADARRFNREQRFSTLELLDW